MCFKTHNDDLAHKYHFLGCYLKLSKMEKGGEELEYGKQDDSKKAGLGSNTAGPHPGSVRRGWGKGAAVRIMWWYESKWKTKKTFGIKQ